MPGDRLRLGDLDGLEVSDGGGLFVGLTSGCVRALYKLILPYAYSSSTPAGPTSSHDSFSTSSTSSGVKIGLMLQIIAMRPAVNGVENDVPEAAPYPLFIPVV